MYTEFIVIFILLGIVMAISVVNLVLLILIKKDGVSSGSNSTGTAFQFQNSYMNQGFHQGMSQGTDNIVFCKNCATQYDASMMRCPKCGTPR